MAEREQFTISVGAMTLGEYLARDGEAEPADGVPSFISPRWLKQLYDKGRVTKRVIEDEAR
jgi:hypothetical protein